MSAADVLVEKAQEYERKSFEESAFDQIVRANGEAGGLMPTVWATVAVTLREVAAALEQEAA